jgi:alkylated DNA repair dioxygenase AlkB
VAASARALREIAGLRLVPEYVDVAHQAHLLNVVDALPWDSTFHRRVQHYGYRYNYRSRRAGAQTNLGPMPGWATELADALARDTPIARTPDQLIVNEYLPGQGISAHVDCVPCFGDVILSISLGSACVIAFAHPDQGTLVHVPVEQGTLMIMTGDARYVWQHSIAARKTDIIWGQRVQRQRRVSLTFRTVRTLTDGPQG